MATQQQTTLAQARQYLADHGIAEPTAVTYSPTFRSDVYATAANGQKTYYNKTQCLSERSAMELMVLLADLDPVGYIDMPVKLQGGDFNVSAGVPWIIFQSTGADRNAGSIAQLWLNNSGDPGGNVAESRARQDIAHGNK